MEGGTPLPAEGSFPRPQALWGTWCWMLAQARQAFMNRPFMRKRPDETVRVAFLGHGHKPQGNNTRVVNSNHISVARPATHPNPVRAHQITVLSQVSIQGPRRISVNVLLFFIPKLTYNFAVQPGSIPGPVPCVITLKSTHSSSAGRQERTNCRLVEYTQDRCPTQLSLRKGRISLPKHRGAKIGSFHPMSQFDSTSTKAPPKSSA